MDATRRIVPVDILSVYAAFPLVPDITFCVSAADVNPQLRFSSGFSGFSQDFCGKCPKWFKKPDFWRLQAVSFEQQYAKIAKFPQRALRTLRDLGARCVLPFARSGYRP